jgi:hypothetical protein
MPSFDGNPEGIFSPRPIDSDAVLHGMAARSHFLLEPESSQAITTLAGEGFADMVTRRLCFLDHRYAQTGLREKHAGCGSAGTATNDRDIGFHPISEKGISVPVVRRRTTRSLAKNSKGGSTQGEGPHADARCVSATRSFEKARVLVKLAFRKRE